MSKYEKLKRILASHKQGEWRVSFAELETLLGGSLPASAYKYPAWWSNNPANNSMTKIWLSAGWCTEQVDVPGQTVVFRRTGPCAKITAEQDDDIYTDYLDKPPIGMTEEAHMFDSKAKPSSKDIFATLYGCMKGTIKIAPGVDLTESAYSGDDEEAFDEKWDRLLPQSSKKQTAKI
jgi:hypothetical protein